MTSRSRRGPLVIAVLLVAALVAGCSDAHTDEEQAWVDTGIGPDIVTLFVDPIFEAPAERLVAAYEASDLTARVVIVARDEDHLAEAVADGDLPSVWMASASTFEGREEDDATVELGSSPLIVAYPRDGRPAPDIEAFASKGNGTGMCPIEDPCGFNGRQLLANMGLTADPDLVDDPDTLVRRVAEDTLPAAMVHSVQVGFRWLRVVNDNIVSDEPDLADPWVARPFGQEGRTADLLDWLATAPEARRVLAGAGLTVPPEAGAEVGS